MLLFYINFGDHNPPYPALGSNIPPARRQGQRFHFLQCRGSLPSLRFINRHGGTLRREGWVAFTKTYSRGKWLISHLLPTFVIIIHIARPLRPCIWRPHVPYLMSSSPSSCISKSQVPTHASRCPRPLVPVPLLYTAGSHSLNIYFLKKNDQNIPFAFRWLMLSKLIPEDGFQSGRSICLLGSKL